MKTKKEKATIFTDFLFDSLPFFVEEDEEDEGEDGEPGDGEEEEDDA